MYFYKILYLVVFYSIKISSARTIHPSASVLFKGKHSPTTSNDSASYTRIINGDAAHHGQFPWEAAIFIYKMYACTGAVITARHILTAGHCFKVSDNSIVKAENVQVGAGYVSLTDLAHRMHNHVAYKLHVHPRLSYYFSYGVATPIHDISIVELWHDIIFTRTLQPLKLPKRGQDFTNFTAILAGWGITKPDATQETNLLLYTTLKIIDTDVCLRSALRRHLLLEKLDMHWVYCAYGGPNDGCKGDSGGALMVKVRDEDGISWISAGIMSWGVSCGRRGYPAVYTRTSHYLDWIQDVIAEEQYQDY